MKLYMAVTADKYELPCVVTDTAAKMAAIYHMQTSNIFQSLARNSVCRKYGIKFVRVEVND